MAKSAAEFWSVFPVLGNGMDEKLVIEFLEGSGILEKLRCAFFFLFSFLMDKESNASCQPIKWFTRNCSDILHLFYLCMCVCACVSVCINK